jgi:peptidyl-prolyl cis-trans isomerase D
MLTALRRLAGTWVAKILFVLLILSFAVWGVEDMFRNFGRDRAVARVGGEAIELEEAQAAARRELQRVVRQLGPRFEADEAVRRALAAQALERLIADRALRVEAERLGVSVPEEAVRNTVFGIEGLQGLDGRFSRQVFDQFLRANELTEAQFLALVRADLARQQVVGGVRSGAAGPDALTRPLLAWVQERRVADVATLPLLDAPDPPEPEEAQLRRYHENNPDRFSAPEYREAAVAVLSAETLMDEVQVPPAEVEHAYEARRAQYETPERRAVEQALVPDEAAARAIAAAWREGGADFATVEARAREAGGQAVDLGTVERAGLPVPELATAVFGAPEGGVTEPVRSPFGWHVLRVSRVEPGTTRSLGEVREELRRELARERAADLAYERANRVEDALAGGATLEEAARRFGLALATVRTDATGQDAEGRPVELPVPAGARAETLRQVFAAQRDDAPRLQETSDGFVAVDVREVIPAALRPFESVADAVRRAYVNEARRRSREEAAAALLAAVRGGPALPEAAQAAGVPVARLGPFPRQPQQGSPMPPELLAPLFEARAPGEATMVETRDGFAVAQLVEVVPADPDADPLALGRMREQVEQSMADDLDAQYAAALRARADVRVNPTLLEAVATR